MDALSNFVFNELKQSISASDQQCRATAGRIAEEVTRICTESQRIQSSGEVESWLENLARHRLKQCLKYYRAGSRQGRVELHSTLSAVVYRYITPPQVQSSYYARLSIIEDFLQNFYVEALSAFRRENKLADTYCPRSLLELAEYMAFTERYAKRRIPLPRRRSQQLIILRAQTFSKQQPPETLVDIEQAAEGGSNETDQGWNTAPIQQVREQMVAGGPESVEDSLRDVVADQLLGYLEDRQQEDCADYFVLRLQDLPAHEIEVILGLTPRQRDYLQQRFKYHLLRFALSHHWELVHQWLEADLERNFGLTPQQWQQFQTFLTEQQRDMLELKRRGLADKAIARQVGCTITQMHKQWSKLLEKAWDIRNNLVSGAKAKGDE
ncbi:MAG: heterocyst differentiation protein HetZ [Merismopedia sp. SIO2A8]|nr:heterocyst differentiation protein HetZ [Merismopedia sp. SIO2A8]